MRTLARLSATVRRVLPPFAAIALAWLACSDDPWVPPSDDEEVDAAVDDEVDGGPSAPECAWASPAEPLPLDGTVKGTLRGDSRNRSTTCTRERGTGGPEAVHWLRLRERSVVELAVTSQFDTVLAVRKACDDVQTEVACVDGQDDPGGVGGQGAVGGFAGGFVGGSSGFPGFGGAGGSVFDAGAPIFATGEPLARSNNPADAYLRRALGPGDYFVIVDEAASFGVGGKYSLAVRVTPPPPHTACAAPRVISDGAMVFDDLELAGSPPPAGCAGLAASPALFYAATVPPGQRLAVRLRPLSGGWTPQMRLYSGCTAAQCLGTDDLSGSFDRVLRWTNQGAADAKLVLAVTGDNQKGARFLLDVSIGELQLHTTCASALPVDDGTRLTNQRLDEGPAGTGALPCGRFQPNARSLFYRTTLAPGQTVEVTARPSGMSALQSQPPLISAFFGCTGAFNSCAGQQVGVLASRNDTRASRDVFFVVSPTDESLRSFSLEVKKTEAPARIDVTLPTASGIAEAGGKSEVTVALASPPKHPVAISVVSDVPQRVTVSPAVLTFTGSNWQNPQRITFTAVDDAIASGDSTVTVRTLAAQSDDPRYAGLSGSTWTLTVWDDEPGLRVVGRGSATTEGGGKVRLQISLRRAPTAEVRVPVALSDASEATVSPAELVLGPGTWKQPQEVTVMGADDTLMDGAKSFEVRFGPLVSSDASYTGLIPPAIKLTNLDDDFAPREAVRVSPEMACVNPPTQLPRYLGIDGRGTIHVVMRCFGGKLPPSGADAGMTAPPLQRDGLFVGSSDDGGASFRTSVVTEGSPSDYALATGRDGLVYVVLTDEKGVHLAYSTDSAKTWSRRTISDAPAGTARIAADGDRVWIAATQGAGTFWFSDAGPLGAFPPRTNVNWPSGPWELALDPTTDKLVLLSLTDGASAFLIPAGGDAAVVAQHGLPIKPFSISWSVAPGRLVGVSPNEMVVLPLAEPGNIKSFQGSFSTSPILAVATDETGTSTLFDAWPPETRGGLRATRWTVDAMRLDGEPKTVSAAANPNAVALSPRAVGTTYHREAAVFFRLDVWP